ncbi:SAM-dependent methyltransferase [Desulfobaculum xiamenense]|uniref:SAM-dependent methyltransferase n=1 Tax=Desulfobaculum xiamenense TaxID=995050 RepID=A0A846QQZ8_9BACT|nr:class I SAM-dependent methyltransferase [Desulfobaculum xiamenense]NJB67079.1 SAM-dependent methyltransferase [Desulfobaculum xiamenense]
MRSPEDAVKACYATWSDSYYEDYYSGAAAYPPVHRDILRSLLAGGGGRTLLDAGCGPASFLRDVTDMGMDLYGFDLTPEMVAEARRVLARDGVPVRNLWQGSVLDAAAFRAPDGGPRAFDAAVCVGVLPHIPEGTEDAVFANLCDALRPGGLAVVEARNELFALFTLNRYSRDFFMDRLIRRDETLREAGAESGALCAAFDALESMFRTDLPPVRTGRGGEPGYDEVLSRTHNPLELRMRFEQAGFADVRTLFYHFHCLPPMLAEVAPEFFRERSLSMENPEDWRGYFMASAFMLVGRRT